MTRLVAAIMLFVTFVSFSSAADKPAGVVAGLRVKSATGGQVVAQSMGDYPLGKWDNNDQLFWQDAKPGDRLELILPVEQTRRQHVAVVLSKAPDYGIVQFSLDGKRVGGQIDLWSPWIGATPPVPLGVHYLGKGNHVLAVELVGKNKASQGTRFGLDQIVLRFAAPPDLRSSDETPELDVLSQLQSWPRLRPGQRCGMFSSYDRTGGNNDGFGGTYSKLWIEDGNTVLAVMSGAGAIERIWFTHSTGRPGLLNLKKEHLKIYVDGQDEPALDVPLEDVFSGRLPQFPKPLVGEGQGGFYCYVPIAYRDGCKVLVEGAGVRFYQITYLTFPFVANAHPTFPSADNVRSFSMAMTLGRKEALDAAVRLWSNPGQVEALGLKDVREAASATTLTRQPPVPPAAASMVQSLRLPAGPRMVRAVLLEGTPEQLKAIGKARVQICWDEAKEPAVDVPLDHFFCQAQKTPPYRALVTGTNDAGWYNFLPMPYRKSAEVRIVLTKETTEAKLRVLTTPIQGPVESFGYLHAVYNQSKPTKPDVYHPFLSRKGQGHYIGTYLVTEGKTKRKIPLWLEGDERFTIDGQLAIHGTGSEDYFNCGWYALHGRLNGPGAQPLHGFPAYGVVGDRPYAAAFRWHLTDPVRWQSTIRAEMEHGADNRFKANYTSAAFFYEPTP